MFLFSFGSVVNRVMCLNGHHGILGLFNQSVGSCWRIAACPVYKYFRAYLHVVLMAFLCAVRFRPSWVQANKRFVFAPYCDLIKSLYFFSRSINKTEFDVDFAICIVYGIYLPTFSFICRPNESLAVIWNQCCVIKLSRTMFPAIFQMSVAVWVIDGSNFKRILL